MSQVIIYKQDNGVVAVVHPTPEALQRFGIEAIAQKDVPAGKPYRVIDSSELPTDRSQRAAWTVDDADLTDGIGAHFNEFSSKITLSE